MTSLPKEGGVIGAKGRGTPKAFSSIIMTSADTRSWQDMFFLRLFECGQCGHYWEIPYGRPKPLNCPKCGSPDVLLGLFDGEMDNGMMDPHLYS